MHRARLSAGDVRARSPAFAFWIVGTIVLLIGVLVPSILIGANPLSVQTVVDALRGNGTIDVDDMPVPDRRKTDSRAAMSADEVRTGLYRHVNERPVAGMVPLSQTITPQEGQA